MIRFNELKIEDNYIIIDVQIEEDECIAQSTCQPQQHIHSDEDLHQH